MILSGLRVIDCGTYIAGPAAAAILSDFGAEVIKIERPPHGDPYRYLPLMPGMPVSDQNYCWILDDRNKKSLALNLTDDEAREALLKLIATADIFITNYQPQLQRKFKLTYEDLAPLNDRLIHASVTGYGEHGDDAEKPGYDATAYWARSGLMFGMHNADADPVQSLAGLGDHPTSVTLFASIMVALYQRQITGRGSRVFTSLMANGIWSNACGVQAALGEEIPLTLRHERDVRRGGFAQPRELDEALRERGLGLVAVRTGRGEQATAGRRRERHRDLELGIVVAAGALEGLGPAAVEHVFAARMRLQVTGRDAEHLAGVVFHREVLRRPAGARHGRV